MASWLAGLSVHWVKPTVESNPSTLSKTFVNERSNSVSKILHTLVLKKVELTCYSTNGGLNELVTLILNGTPCNGPRSVFVCANSSSNSRACFLARSKRTDGINELYTNTATVAEPKSQPSVIQFVLSWARQA